MVEHQTKSSGRPGYMLGEKSTREMSTNLEWKPKFLLSCAILYYEAVWVNANLLEKRPWYQLNQNKKTH